jgi:hypothetical protein
VPQEERFGESLVGVTHVGVERASAIEVVIPAHWMAVAVRAALVALLVDVDEDADARVDRFEVVELVHALPAVGESFGGRVTLVEHAKGALADVWIVWMAVEAGAREPAVPRPVVLRIRGGMNSHVSAASLDVALEIILLCGVEHVTGRVQKHDCAVFPEIFRRERAGVFGRFDGESVLLSELSDSGDPDSD